MKKNSFGEIIIFSIVLAGLLLSLIQYFYNRSLWLDEAYLSLNIINRSHFDLLKPLDYIQVAPILFLQIEKTLSELIPNTEYGLRLLPLLSFWFSIFFFYKIIRVIHDNYYTIIFSLSLFVFNITLIYYSSEVKQYMMDVLAVTSVFYLVIKKYRNEGDRYYFLALAGVIGIFLSNVSPIILLTAGIYLLSDIYRNNKKYLIHLAIVSVVWASAFLIYYLMFIHNHPFRNAQITSFSNVEGNVFMPRNPFRIDFYLFLIRAGGMIVVGIFKYKVFGGIILLFFILAGIIILIKKRLPGIIILAIMPILIHIILSGFKLYPFYTRLVLYTCPGIIIICSFAFNYLINVLFNNLKNEVFRKLLLVLIPLLIGFPVFCHGFPQQYEEIKKSINYIHRHNVNDDKIYVYYSSYFALKYYREIHFVHSSDSFIFGTSNRGNDKRYIEELLRLKGRNWLLFSHNFKDEESNIIRQLDVLDYKKIEEFNTKGSSAYLYDFGK